MTIELHNYILSKQRLVQVDSQVNHIDGVLDVIQNIRRNSNLDWEDIYSAYYECDEDSTITFYEGESAEASDPGIRTYVVYDCAAGEEEIVSNPNIDALSALLKLREIIKEDNSNSVNLLPNVENAVIDICKLRDYSLNRDHPKGKDKARLFSSILGMTAENAEELRQIILEKVKIKEACSNTRDQHGQRYYVDFTLQRQNRSATIRSCWIIEPGSDFPRLTSCYIKL